MKLAVLFIFIGCLQVSAKTYSQNVSLSVTDASLQTILGDLKKQTGYDFFYDNMDLQNTRKVTLRLKEVSLETALKACFQGQPVALDFKITGKIVNVFRKEVVEREIYIPSSDPHEIEGTITDESGTPLYGASVKLKGGKVVAITDEKGNFKVKNAPANGAFEITFTGYGQAEVLINNKSFLKISLKRSTNKLDEVQVIAYGTTSKRFSTGDVTTISAVDIEKQPVDNPLLALEGRVPGMFITQANGLPGTGVVVQIRGQNSITNGNDPFYVVDGVPYTSELLPNLAGGLLGNSGLNAYTAGGGSPLNFINPSDIESISVLKDADATAIYGSRAANGAILITTKKGRVGKMKVDINVQEGGGGIARKLSLLNTPQYLSMRHEAYYNDSVANPGGYTPPNIRNASDLFVWDTTRYTDWQKTLLGGLAQYTNLSASSSGGNESTQYLVSATYHRQTSVFPGSFADQKGSLHFNINSVSSNGKFKIQFSGSFLADENRLPGTDLTGTAITLAPIAPTLYKKDGTLNWAISPTTGYGTWSNPLSYTYQPYKSRTDNLTSNVLLSYRLLPGLEIKSSFGYNNMQITEYQLNPLIAMNPITWAYVSRTASYTDNNLHSWIIEPQLTYKSTIAKGKLEILAATTINRIASTGQILNGSGYNSDLVLQDIQAAATVSVSSATSSLYRYAAIFGRLSYTWDDKYLANLTLRRDGSSRFGSDNQFHDFSAAGIGWIFSEEKLVKNNMDWLSFGKLRASYGTTGNDQIGDYQFMNLYNPIGVAVPYQGAVGLKPNGLTNPYLQWEQTRKLEFGADLGFLKDKILMGASYFRNRSSNELIGYNLPNVTGFGSITLNFPATVQNAGWEFTINTTNVKTKRFTWVSSFNLSATKNKLLAFPTLSSSSYSSSLVIGQPVSIKKEFHLIGVNDTTGIYQFSSKSQGGASSDPVGGTDNTVLINTTPKYYGGLDNSFRYQGLELEFLFQFVKQIGANYVFGATPGTRPINQPTSVLRRWQKAGDLAPIQRYNANSSLDQQFYNAQFYSDAGYSDASFIRLKNLSVSWHLPISWGKKVGVENATIYLQGQNLLTITRFKGMDPENQSSTSLPPLRMITAGFKIAF